MITCRRVALFLGLLTVFIACSGEFSILYARLAVMYIAGAYLAVFAEGTEIGILQPISTRPVMIVVGVMLMAGSVMWLLAIRDAFNG